MQTGDSPGHYTCGFLNHGDVRLDSSVALDRQPFKSENPDGPLELCTCSECGTLVMLDDKEGRIRAIVLI